MKDVHGHSSTYSFATDDKRSPKDHSAQPTCMRAMDMADDAKGPGPSRDCTVKGAGRSACRLDSDIIVYLAVRWERGGVRNNSQDTHAPCAPISFLTFLLAVGPFKSVRGQMMWHSGYTDQDHSDAKGSHWKTCDIPLHIRTHLQVRRWLLLLLLELLLNELQALLQILLELLVLLGVVLQAFAHTLMKLSVG